MSSQLPQRSPQLNEEAGKTKPVRQKRKPSKKEMDLAALKVTPPPFDERERSFLAKLKFTSDMNKAAEEAGFPKAKCKDPVKKILLPLIKKNPPYMQGKLAKLGYSDSQFFSLLARASGIPEPSIPRQTSYEEALERAGNRIYPDKSVIDAVAETNLEALQATRHIKDGKGGLKEVVDHPTRLQAVQTYLKATGNMAPDKLELQGKILHGHMVVPRAVQDALFRSTNKVYERYRLGQSIEHILMSDFDGEEPPSQEVIDAEFIEEPS